MPDKTNLVAKVILESLKSEWRYWTRFSVASTIEKENITICEFAIGFGNAKPEIYKITIAKVSGEDYS